MHHPRYYPDVKSVEPQVFFFQQQDNNVPQQQQQHSSSSSNHNNNSNNSNAMLHNHTHTVLVAILIALIALFVGILAYLLVPVLLRALHRQWAASHRRVQRRYETIEGWLISKKVRSHCKTCEQVQKQCKNNNAKTAAAPTTTKTPPKATCNDDHCGGSSSNSNQEKVKLSPSYDTAETEPMGDNDFNFDDNDNNHHHHHRNNTHECTICYEDFAAGDIVSWSPRPPSSSRCHSDADCRHVFHHECIKEWLLHHDTCPCCRVTFLPVDQQQPQTADGDADDDNVEKTHAHSWWSRQKSQHLRTWIDERSHRLKTTYYCLQEGLVILGQPLMVPQQHSDSNTDASNVDDGLHQDKKLRRFVGSGVKPAVLARLRQSRSSASPAASKNSNSPAASNESSENTTSGPASSSPRETAAAVAPSSSANANNSTAARPQLTPFFLSSAPSSSNSPSSSPSVVDLELCMQQLRALSNDAGNNESSSNDDEEAENEGIFLDTESTPVSHNSAPLQNCGDMTPSPPQPLHRSHAVVVDIEMSMNVQQQQQRHSSATAAAATGAAVVRSSSTPMDEGNNDNTRRVREDWESASF